MANVDRFPGVDGGEAASLCMTEYSVRRTMFRHVVPSLCLFWVCLGHVLAGNWSPTSLSLPLPASLIVPRNASTGTVLWTSSPSTASVTGQTASAQFWLSVQGASLVSGYTDVYQTSLPSIGIRWYAKLTYPNGCSGGCTVTFPITAATGGAGLIPNPLPQSVWYELILVGPLSAGALSAVAAPRISFDANSGGNYRLNLSSPGTTSIAAATCQTHNVQVNMGSVPISAFKGPGTRSSATSFQIALLNCPANIKSVMYRLDPTSAILVPGRAVVALEPSAGNAGGIGLQVLDNNNNPLPLQTDLSFNAYQPVGGNFVILLKAAYYQTASTVTAGTANTQMIFTLTYQ